MLITKTECELDAVKRFFEIHASDKDSLTLEMVEGEILDLTYVSIDAHNKACQKDEKWLKSSQLGAAAAATVLLEMCVIRNVNLCPDNGMPVDGTDGCFLLGVYDEDEGIYRIGDRAIIEYIRRIDANFSIRGTAEILNKIREMAPSVVRTANKDLIPVKNGIFDYRNKKLLPFSPEYVYLTKCPVNYVPSAVNPVIHNDNDGTDWDVESWMSSLSDDPDIVNLLWQVCGAIIRPGVRWNKAAWLYSSSGNSGKGTLCALMRNLCGPGNHTSISIAQFDGNPFMLSPLVHASAVIVDENDVGVYIDRSKNLKAAITGDVMQIDRKYKNPISYQFQGFIVQCLNELPRIRDRSESYSRRQLFIPMSKCFTGMERKYIKDDYLARQEVLEYVLLKILNSNYYDFDEPESCRELLDEYKSMNNPVRDFCEQILPQLAWDFVPFAFLYDLYSAWFKKNVPSGTIQSSRFFVTELLDVLRSSDFDFYGLDKRKYVRVGSNMAGPEILIAEYKLTDWMSKYSGNDVNKLCCPNLAQGYHGGISRKQRNYQVFGAQAPVLEAKE